MERNASMRNYLAILEKELKSYFLSPVAYVVLGLFVAAAGLYFYILVMWFDRVSMQSMMYAQQYRQMPPPLNVNLEVIQRLLGFVATVALLVIPGLTMRLFAEEKRQGTMELLATSPLTNWQITLGKFSSALLFFSAMLLATGIFVGLLFFYGKPELGPILSGYLGLLLVGGCFIALGMLCSAFTENQILAIVSAFFVNLLFLIIGILADFVGTTAANFFSAISPLLRFDDFSKGILDTKHIIFYLSFIFGGIFLTYVTVESARWRGTR
jgi:ABC-2 type transport system permease protein